MSLAAFLAEAEKVEKFPTVLEQAAEVANNRSKELDKQEEENRVLRRKACMQFPSVRILPCGCQAFVTNLCGDYRMCDNCREKYFREKIEAQLRYAHNHLPIGEWLKWVKIHDNDKEAYLKAIGRYGGQYKNFPQPNRMNLLVHNAEGFGDPELYDYDEYEGQDVNFKEVLANVPENKRISGKLGNKTIIEDEGEGDNIEEPPDEFESVRVPYLHSPTATKRDLNLAYMKAVGKTQNIAVSDPGELSQATFRRLEEMKKLLPEDTYIYWQIRAIGHRQAAMWNDNPNNGVVQIVGIENGYTYYSDKDYTPGLFAFLKEGGEIPKDAVLIVT